VRVPRVATAFLLAAALPGCIFAVDGGGRNGLEKRLDRIERRIDRMERERAGGPIPGVSAETVPPR
jgi:hypothetical protein